MKTLFKAYPNISRLFVGATFISLALVLSGLINFPFLKNYFPFIGTIFVVAATWTMYRSENKNLSELGFDFKKYHLLFLPVGLFIGILSFLIDFYAGYLVKGGAIHLNHNINFKHLLLQLYCVLPTAIVQEFLVVGYCFKKLIEISNVKIATIVFGLIFISMHNFWNGNIIETLFYASCIFIGYLLFSTALLKSRTILFPIGIHWGNNFANSNLFTQTHNDTSLLFTSNQQMNSLSWTQVGFLFLSLNIGALILILLILKWKSTKKLVITS